MVNSFKYGLPPIVDENSKILILGSLPGERSLQQSEYYAHPQNQFWKIISSILNEPTPIEYNQKKAMLIKNSIALWDVIHFAEREGSLDSDIKNEATNDFNAFFKHYPNISQIIFNGDKASKLFSRNYKNIIIDKFTVPSTSPARANLTVEQKIERWKSALHIN